MDVKETFSSTPSFKYKQAEIYPSSSKILYLLFITLKYNFILLHIAVSASIYSSENLDCKIMYSYFSRCQTWITCDKRNEDPSMRETASCFFHTPMYTWNSQKIFPNHYKITSKNKL